MPTHPMADNLHSWLTTGACVISKETGQCVRNHGLLISEQFEQLPFEASPSCDRSPKEALKSAAISHLMLTKRVGALDLECIYIA